MIYGLQNYMKIFNLVSHFSLQSLIIIIIIALIIIITYTNCQESRRIYNLKFRLLFMLRFKWLCGYTMYENG